MFLLTLLFLPNSAWAQDPNLLYRKCLIETAARTAALKQLEEIHAASISTLSQNSKTLVAQVQAQYRKMNQSIQDNDIPVLVPPKISPEQRRAALSDCEKLNHKLAMRIEFFKNRIFSAIRNQPAPTIMSSQSQEKTPKIDPGLDAPAKPQRAEPSIVPEEPARGL